MGATQEEARLRTQEEQQRAPQHGAYDDDTQCPFAVGPHFGPQSISPRKADMKSSLLLLLLPSRTTARVT